MNYTRIFFTFPGLLLICTTGLACDHYITLDQQRGQQSVSLSGVLLTSNTEVEDFPKVVTSVLENISSRLGVGTIQVSASGTVKMLSVSEVSANKQCADFFFNSNFPVSKLDENAFITASFGGWERLNLLLGPSGDYSNGTYLGDSNLIPNSNNMPEASQGADRKVGLSSSVDRSAYLSTF